MASSNTNLDFYNNPLTWQPLRDWYPTNDDVMQYFIRQIKVNCDRIAVKRDLPCLLKINGRKEMPWQNLTFIFRNNLMDYTIHNLDTFVKEEEVKIVMESHN